MTRVKLDMTFVDTVYVLSEGNPGACQVLMQMWDKGKEIDPHDLLAPLGNILFLDTLKIYSFRIWQLFSDVCKRDLHHMLGLLRAVQLGFLEEEKLHHAIDNYGEGIDIPDLMKQVCERLPNFKGEK